MPENTHTGKRKKIYNWKMPEQKMHNLENGRKATPLKMIENEYNVYP